MTHYLLTIEQADGEVNIGSGVSEKYVDTKINELNNKIDTKTTMDEVKDVLSDQYTSKITFDSTLSGYTTTNDLKENILTNYAKTIITDSINDKLTSTTSISPGHKHTTSDLTDFATIETKNNEQDERLNTIESELPNKADLTDFATIETKNNEQDERLNTIESELPNKANVSHTHTVAEITDFVSPDLSDYAKITTDEENGMKVLDIGNSSIMAIAGDETNSGIMIRNKVEGIDYGLLTIVSYKDEDEDNNLKHNFNLNGETFVDGNLQVFNGDISINGEPLTSKFATITVDESGYKTFNIGDVFIKSIKDDTASDTNSEIAIGIKKTDGEVILFNSDTSGTNKTIYVYDDLFVYNNLHVNGTITSLKPVTLNDSLTATNINATDSLTATNINATDITTNTINGYNLGMNDNFYNLPAIPVINSDLSMEVGKYLDFHNPGSTSNDYDGRIHFATYAFHCSHSLYIDNGCKLTAANVISDKGNLNDVITKISSFTVTHETGANEELIVGTFCETDGTIYEKFKDDIKPTDCICNIKQSTSMNKNIIGVTVSTDPIKFATHGDVLLKVVNDTYNVGDILVPGQGGYGKKPSSDEIMSCLLNRIPTAKIISLDTGIDNEVACILL